MSDLKNTIISQVSRKCFKRLTIPLNKKYKLYRPSNLDMWV